MNEEEKINQILEQYHQYFQTTTADVAHSIKGEHIFYIVDRLNGEYYSFQIFSTAEQLEKIILYEIADNLNQAIEVGIENLDAEIKEYNVSRSCCENHEDAVNHLANSLDAIYKEYNRWRDTVIHSLDDLMKHTKLAQIENDD